MASVASGPCATEAQHTRRSSAPHARQGLEIGRLPARRCHAPPLDGRDVRRSQHSRLPEALGRGAQARLARVGCPQGRPTASAGRVISETEKLYRESIERDRAVAQYHRDRARYAFFEKKQAEQADRKSVV